MSRLVVLVLGVIALAAAAVVLLGGDDGRREVRAEFRDAAGLRPGSAVRVNGATVGSVRELRVTPRDTAEVVLDVEPDAVPGAGARAAVRPLNLLGEKFVELQVGDRARPTGRIPMTRTSTPVELDDVLDVLEPRTRNRLALLVAETGIALGGRGEDLAAALRRLPPTVDDARELLAQLGEDTAVVEDLLVQADRVADRVASERGSLGRLVRTAAEALAAPAARQPQLEAMLRRTPPALRELRATLGRLDRAGDALRPAAQGLRATAPALTSTLRAIPGFRRDAAPALRGAREVAPDLVRLGREASPTVRRLRPAAAELSGLAQDAAALTRTLDEGAGADLLSVMQNWALAIQTRDGVGHLFRVSLSLTPDLLRQLDAYVDPPARRRRRAPARPPRAVEDVRRQAGETLRREVEPATEPVKPLLDRVGKAVQGVTDPQQDGGVAGLLDLLLGP